MIQQLNQTKQRYIAVSILLFVIVLLIGVVAVPVWNMNNYYSEQIRDIAHRLNILKRTTEEGMSLRPQYEELKEYHSSDKRYLQSTSEALAAAELQKIIKDIVVPTDGEILSTQIIQNKDDQLIPKITLKARIRSNLQSLVKILYEIENGSPYLFIEDMNVRSRIVRRRRRRSSEVDQLPTLLDVQFEVSGYIRGNVR